MFVYDLSSIISILCYSITILKITLLTNYKFHYDIMQTIQISCLA